MPSCRHRVTFVLLMRLHLSTKECHLGLWCLSFFSFALYRLFFVDANICRDIATISWLLHAPMISLFSTPAELTLPARANAATHGISHPVHMLATTLSLVPFFFLVFTESCTRYLYETQGPLLSSLQPTFSGAVSTFFLPGLRAHSVACEPQTLLLMIASCSKIVIWSIGLLSSLGVSGELVGSRTCQVTPKRPQQVANTRKL